MAELQVVPKTCALVGIVAIVAVTAAACGGGEGEGAGGSDTTTTTTSTSGDDCVLDQSHLDDCALK